MTYCTPVCDLPGPSAEERFCDSAPTWLALAERINEILAEQDAVLGRTADTVPFAHVQITDPVTYTGVSTTSLTWDSVSADTDSMVDLDVDPYSIYPKRSGIWVIHTVVHVAKSTATNVDISNGLLTPYPTLLFSQEEDYWTSAPSPGSTIPTDSMALISNDIVIFTDSDIASSGFPRVVCQMNLGSGDTVIKSAQMTVRWHGEAINA